MFFHHHKCGLSPHPTHNLELAAEAAVGMAHPSVQPQGVIHLEGSNFPEEIHAGAKGGSLKKESLNFLSSFPFVHIF